MMSKPVVTTVLMVLLALAVNANCQNIIKGSNGLCVNVRWESKDNCDPIILYPCHETALNDKFIIGHTLISQFLIEAGHSFKCLTPETPEKDVSLISQRNCTKSRPEQLWTTVTSNRTGREGWIMIRNHYANKCITVPPKGQGSYIVQQECNDSDSQLFQWLGTDRLIRSYSLNGRCLDFFGDKREGAGPVVFQCNVGLKQQQFGRLRVVAFRIQAAHSLKCLDNSGQSELGNSVIQYDCKVDDDSQLWVQYEYPNEPWRRDQHLRNVGNNKCLSVHPVQSNRLNQVECEKDEQRQRFAIAPA